MHIITQKMKEQSKISPFYTEHRYDIIILSLIHISKIKEVLVPKSNKPDIKELDEEITDGLKITFVENMNEVLERALA